MIFVIVPAYNEEKSIGRVLRGFFETQFKDESLKNMKVVVVDDGSVDNTVQIASQAGATVLRHEINRGQGAALQTGNQYALEQGASIVVHFDADGQFNPVDIESGLMTMKNKGVDVVLGSRFLDNRSKMPWSKKYLLLPISRFVNRLLTGLKLTDAHNGFRILSRKALQKINISQDRMAHNSEIVKQIKQHNLLFAEHPVEVVYTEYGQGVGGGLKILQDLLAAKFLR